MSIGKTLFAAADKMRGSSDPGAYKPVAPGLLFLRYVSEAFQRVHDPLSQEDCAGPEDREEDPAENVIRAPAKARRRHIAANAKDPRVGGMVDEAMRAVEAENDTLRDALAKVFGKESLDRSMLTSLIDLFTYIKLGGDRGEFDLIGRIFASFIGEFAAVEGKRGGEFYTPKSVIDTLAEMLEPTQGRVCAPRCGAGASSFSPDWADMAVRKEWS